MNSQFTSAIRALICFGVISTILFGVMARADEKAPIVPTSSNDSADQMIPTLEHTFWKLPGGKQKSVAASFQNYPDDDFTVLTLPDGEHIFVEILRSSNKTAVAALKQLKYSIYIARSKDARVDASMKGTNPAELGQSPIFLYGYFEGVFPAVKTQRPGGDLPKRAGFKLISLIIHVPFVEYPQLPADMDYLWKPIKRNDLKPADFRPPFDPGKIHYNSQKRFYWIGENPR